MDEYIGWIHVSMDDSHIMHESDPSYHLSHNVACELLILDRTLDSLMHIVQYALPHDSLHDDISTASLLFSDVINPLDQSRVPAEPLHDFKLSLTVNEHLLILASDHFHRVLCSSLLAPANLDDRVGALFIDHRSYNAFL